MKKLFTTLALTIALTGSAIAGFDFDFWNTDNNGFVAVDRNGFPVEDNGIFAFNPYEFTNPKWYAQEFINMVDEVDNEFDNDSYRKFTGYNFPATGQYTPINN